MPVSALEAKAGEIMSIPPIVVSEQTTLKEAAKLMIENGIGCLPVVDQMGRLTGVVNERTFQVQLAGVKPDSAQNPDRRVFEELFVDGPDRLSSIQESFVASYSRPVAQCMLKDQPTVTKGTPLWQVAETLLKAHISHVIVVQDGKPIGIVARHDLMRAYAGG